MGRHAAPSPGPEEPGPREAAPGDPAGDDRPASWTDRLLVAGIVGLAAGGVVGWVSTAWVTAGVVALGTGALTLLASWIASTLPGTGR